MAGGSLADLNYGGVLSGLGRQATHGSPTSEREPGRQAMRCSANPLVRLACGCAV